MHMLHMAVCRMVVSESHRETGQVEHATSLSGWEELLPWLLSK
jgi:hypothetical protein